MPGLHAQQQTGQSLAGSALPGNSFAPSRAAKAFFRPANLEPSACKFYQISGSPRSSELIKAW